MITFNTKVIHNDSFATLLWVQSSIYLENVFFTLVCRYNIIFSQQNTFSIIRVLKHKKVTSALTKQSQIINPVTSLENVAIQQFFQGVLSRLGSMHATCECPHKWQTFRGTLESGWTNKVFIKNSISVNFTFIKSLIIRKSNKVQTLILCQSLY